MVLAIERAVRPGGQDSGEIQGGLLKGVRALAAAENEGGLGDRGELGQRLAPKWPFGSSAS